MTLSGKAVIALGILIAAATVLVWRMRLVRALVLGLAAGAALGVLR